MADIKEKIKKLLALAQSPNENEARDALLKARELMAKNKLSDVDFEDKKEAKLTTAVCDEIKWTTDSGEIWVCDICKTIADNYLCTAAWQTPRGTRTHVLVITGIGEDAELCKEVIKYAVGFVRGAIKALQRKNPSGDGKTIAKSYAQGFTLGLELAFEEQKEEHQEWGLVMVKPQEVKDYEDSLGSRSVRTKKTAFDPLAYLRGQNDGQNFNAQRVLPAN